MEKPPNNRTAASERDSEDKINTGSKHNLEAWKLVQLEEQEHTSTEKCRKKHSCEGFEAMKMLSWSTTRKRQGTRDQATLDQADTLERR